MSKASSESPSKKHQNIFTSKFQRKKSKLKSLYISQDHSKSDLFNDDEDEDEEENDNNNNNQDKPLKQELGPFRPLHSQYQQQSDPFIFD